MTDLNVNERRAAAIRRHHSHPGVVTALKEQIRAMVLDDRPAKETAFSVNLSAGKVCKWIHVLGFTRMYVTAAERAAVMKMRAEASASDGRQAA